MVINISNTMDDNLQDDNINLVSQGLFMIIKEQLGSEDRVKLRREEYQIKDMMINANGPTIRHTSGSKAEGLDMKSSDIDQMFWHRNVSFVETHDQLCNIHDQFDVILLMDTSISSPGFTLLRVEKNTKAISDISYSMVNVLNGRYVSSAKIRQYWQQRFSYGEHGPCISCTFGGAEFDFAPCLHSQYWPRQATGCIRRLFACGWPSQDTLRHIVNEGCNVVPISSKTPRFSEANDMEWRISFFTCRENADSRNESSSVSVLWIIETVPK